MKTRNILLIGATGNGKSTLANVLTNSEEFKEGSGLISTTRKIQSKEFKIGEVDYRIIDTPGLNDTKLSDREILELLGETSELLKDGITQIFFVVKNKITKTEINNYNLLKEFLFDEEVYKHTTIIKSAFPNFKNEEACREKTEEMKQESPQLKEMVESSGGIVFVEFTPLEGVYKEIAEKIRLESKDKIIEHLSRISANYQPDNLITLPERVKKYLSQEEEFEKTKQELAELAENLKKLEVRERNLTNLTFDQKKELEQSKKQLKLEQEQKERELAELNQSKDKIFEIERQIFRSEVRDITRERDKYQR